MPHPVVVIGAGPAGLTAALRLVQAGRSVVVLEADNVVGGLSQTVEREGWRFDIGGHRFFTKVPAVEKLWREILPSEDFLTRPRLSRIFYRGKFYDYPIRPLNALTNLGVFEAVRCVVSYAKAHFNPRREPSSLEDYIVNNYGWRLYQHFFKSYNEKVWGISPAKLSADWGAQRIKGMSLWTAVTSPITSKIRARLTRHVKPGGKSKQVTSLIERFQYPRLGPGMMWERCRELVEAGGGVVLTGVRVNRIEHVAGHAVAVHAVADGVDERLECSEVISSMPLTELVRSLDPPAPQPVVDASRELSFRDFLTVALVVDRQETFPDNWIYIHDPSVHVGRIQNFGNWSPELVKEGLTCLGLEFFVHEGDGLWSRSDEELVALATDELVQLGLAPRESVLHGYAVRVPKAYPVYDTGYGEHVDVLRRYLDESAPNVWPVGRNGMHRYNNQDHSMMTSMLTVENILGADHDIWAVNVEADYHETNEGNPTAATPADDVEHATTESASSAPERVSADFAPARAGRDAPILPRRVNGNRTTLSADDNDGEVRRVA